MRWKRAAVVAIAVVAGVFGIVFLTLMAVRPERPDLARRDLWSIAKAARVASSDVYVYVYKRESTGWWDHYDVMQNRIVVDEKTSRAVFMWPRDYEMAAAWCEVLETHGATEFALALFGSESIVRVVAYSDGRFVFRPDIDELIVDGRLRYLGPAAAGFEFEAQWDGPGTTRTVGVWQWTRAGGFLRVPRSSVADYRSGNARR